MIKQASLEQLTRAGHQCSIPDMRLFHITEDDQGFCIRLREGTPNIIIPSHLPFGRQNLPIPVGFLRHVPDHLLAYGLGTDPSEPFSIATGDFSLAPDGTPSLRTKLPSESSHCLFLVVYESDAKPPREQGLDSKFAKLYHAQFYHHNQEYYEERDLKIDCDFWVIPISHRLTPLIYCLESYWQSEIQAGERFLTEYHAHLEEYREKFRIELLPQVEKYSKTHQLTLEPEEAIFTSTCPLLPTLRARYFYTEESFQELQYMLDRFQAIDSLCD